MTKTEKTRLLHWGALALILLAGAVLRFGDLTGTPPGLWFDEALNAQDAIATARGDGLRMVYARVFPREPMYPLLLAFTARFISAELVALRATSAAIGLMTVLLLYLMLRSVANERLALIGAAILALLRWHVIFSHLMFRTLLLPFWITLIVLAGHGVRKSPNWWRAALFGAAIGGGFYTYLGWYFMLPGVAGLFAWVFWPGRRDAHGLRLALVCLGVAIAVAAPIGIHYARFPDDIFSRPGAVSVFSDGFGPGMREIGQNFVEGLGMFHYRGDHVARHSIPWAPALDPITGAFFAVGLAICIIRLGRRCALETILVGWLALGFMPTVLTKTDSPNFLRTLVLTPAVASVAAVGMIALWEVWRRRRPRGKANAAGALAIIALLGITAIMTARDVFVRWADSPDVWSAFSPFETQLGKAAAATPEGTSFWVPGAMGEHLSFKFLSADQSFPDEGPRVIPYDNFDFLRENTSPAGPRRIVATAHNQVLPVLRRLAPEGRIVERFAVPAVDGAAPAVWAWLYEIRPGDLPEPGETDASEAAHPVKDIGW